jgi:hypothetical protein
MKKTLLTLAVVIMTAFSMNAQSADMSLSWDGEAIGDTLDVWGKSTAAEIVSHIVLHNNTDNGINVKVRRRQLSMLEGTSSAFCWGLCFPPSTEESPEARLILAHSQSADEEFSGHYYPEGMIGTSMVEYMFFNEGNEDQNVKVVVRYWSSVSSIAEDAMQGGSISDIYPNPAVNFVSIDYSMPASVQSASVSIVNLLGSVVKEAVVERNAGKLTMDISGLKGGIYFYTVRVNGDIYKTKKLVVRK